MKKICIVLFAILLSANVASAQQTCPILALDDGRIFPVIVIVGDGKDAKESQFSGNDEKGKPSVVLDVPVGQHVVRVQHYRLGFPQPVKYRIQENQKVVWESESTVDPRVINLKKGQKLLILVERPMESYNAKFFRVHGVDCSIVLPRPYWFQDVGPGQFKGKEAFPNSLFFLISKRWGPEKIFGQLADFAAEEMKAENTPLPLGDYRKNHVSLLVALESTGGLPEKLLKLSKKELAADLKVGMLKAYGDMLAEKTYRPFPAQDIRALKKMGYLPADWPDDRLVVTFRQGLQFAEPLLQKWLEN